MDSSNRLKWVLYGFQVNLHDLSSEDVITIFHRGIELVKPVLKYLPDFEPLDIKMNKSGGSDTRFTDPACVTFPPTINPGTKVRQVYEFENTTVKPTRLTKGLCLTDSGELLLWSASYQLVELGRFQVREQATLSQFELVTDEVLRLNMNQGHMWSADWKIVLMRTLGVLQQATYRGVEKRKEQLKSVTRSHDELGSLLSRLNC